MKPERAPLPEVIARLARDAKPVRPLPSPLTRWGVWTLMAIAGAGLATVVFGVRHDLALHLRDVRFVLAASFTGILALAAAADAFLLSVPGVSPGRIARTIPLLALIAWGILLWTRMMAIGNPIAEIAATPRHPACVVLILMIGAVPGVSLFAMLRQAAPLDVRWTGVCAALGALACGALGTQFVCNIDAPGHQLLWHFVPVVLLTSAGFALGAGTFRRLR